MAKNKVTIKQMDGTIHIVKQASMIRVENGVLKMFVDDTSYTSHSEGYPLLNIQSYRVEED